jgi:hypothetical protein
MDRRLLPALAAGVGALMAATALPAHAAEGTPAGTPEGKPLVESYGTKAVYEPRQNRRTYEKVPQGFTPVFTQIVSRHGSRAASDSADGDLILALWREAESEGQLTAEGRLFGPRVQQLLDAMSKVGYGELSGRGKDELRDEAVRMEQRLPGLFDEIAEKGERIDVVSSGVARATDSGTAFTEGLTDSDPELKALIGPTRTDKDLLYFHKAAGGAAYRDYIDNDPRLADTVKGITEQPATEVESERVLRKLFTEDFVRRVADGEFASIGSAYDAALAVYNLYAIAPAMSDESPDGAGWGMQRFISPREAAWFGYLGDTEDFYEKGPGFAGSDITYNMAGVLLDDLFEKVEAKRDGTSDLGAELRFTHAEEIIPLAALMGLPESTRGVTEEQPYTYATSPWRGSDVAPLGANIQWDLYRKGGTYLVRMLYNEKETAFRAGCVPVSKGSKFYELDELERCFGRTN